MANLKNILTLGYDLDMWNGIIVIMGAAVKSIYEMLIPDFKDQLEGRQFGQGEGVLVLQGLDLRFIKCIFKTS
ncbi:MAG: hypothetical protein FWH10_01550 [Oscillospiraceae bacterium]|nr:hypothetical protein [Oscillospiraceae bacterium]